MPYLFSINDDVHHQGQRPQGRADNGERAVYTIVACLPIEADGRIRYRIKSKTENFERVVTEDELSQWIRRSAFPLQVGDRVLFGKWSGSEVKIDGEDLLIMKESDILGVLTDTSAKKKAA